jgi:hypothetical protein
MKLWYVVQGKDSRTATLDDMRNLQWPQDAPALHLQNVQCLSGIHRIEATRRFLNENDKWWIVRLFSYG